MLPLNDDDQTSLIAKDTYKSKYRVIIIALSASLSSVIQGYGIKQITSIPIETFERNFDTQMDKNLFEGFLMGIMPLGGLLGSLLSNLFITTMTRRQGMHIVVPLLALATLLMQVTTIKTLFLGRFVQGICIGYYISIAPIYLQQITPKQLKSIVGTFFGLGKIIGVLLSIILALVLGDQAWRLLLSVNLILGLIQSLLLETIGFDTPFQWIIRDNQIKAEEAVKDIYLENEVYSILEQFNLDFKLEKDKKNKKQEDLSIIKKKKTALIMAIGACLSRHLTGGNALITAAGVIMSKYSQQLGKWTPLSINTIQLIALCIYIFIFAKSVGKRPVLVYSSALLTFINIILVFSLVYSFKIGIFISVATFLIVYGILLSVTWSYPSEIMPASEALLPNIMHWLALSLSTLAPFFIMAAMPNNQVYPCFIFFACYCLLSFIFYYLFAVESNGLTYQRIIVKFKEW